MKPPAAPPGTGGGPASPPPRPPATLPETPVQTPAETPPKTPATPPARRRTRRLAASAATSAATIAAIGAILAAFSEFWFYRLSPGPGLSGALGLGGLVLIYGLFGLLFLLTLRLFQARAFASFFVAAAMFGFFIEGVPVPVLYAKLPFSLAWTSLAWHALLTVSLGFYLYRRIMARASLRAAVALNLAIGAGLGVWNAYSWNATEGAGAVVYAWQPVGAFAGQFLLGWGLFVAGHALFDRLRPGAQPPARRAFAALLGLAMLAWVLGVFRPYFPASLILPFLVLLSLASLRAGLSSPPSPWLGRFLALAIPPRRYALTPLIPALAIAVYALIRAAELEWETNVFVAGLTVPVASLYWLYALLSANHAGHRSRPDTPPDARLNER